MNQSHQTCLMALLKFLICCACCKGHITIGLSFLVLGLVTNKLKNLLLLRFVLDKSFGVASE
jgi:hypothetical protein